MDIRATLDIPQRSLMSCVSSLVSGPDNAARTGTDHAAQVSSLMRMYVPIPLTVLFES